MCRISAALWVPTPVPAPWGLPILKSENSRRRPGKERGKGGSFLSKKAAEGKGKRALQVGAVLLGLAAAAAVFFLLRPPCLVLESTGFYCGACGFTRMVGGGFPAEPLHVFCAAPDLPVAFGGGGALCGRKASALEAPVGGCAVGMCAGGRAGVYRAAEPAGFHLFATRVKKP